MPSVQPVTVSDLNGVEFNPGEMIIDDVVGYVGYVRNLCSDLGTSRDTPEGYNDFLTFQNEIQNAHISTFEPDVVDANYTFETIDLTGSNDPIREYPFMTYNACVGNQPFWSYSEHVTPFNMPETGVIRADRHVTPFDFASTEELNKPGGFGHEEIEFV
jgi:hypothetical protein